MWNKHFSETGVLLGHSQIHGRALFFFGTRYLLKENLSQLFPHFDFRFLKQVHGDRVVEASATLTEADGHWSRTPGVAVAVQTADCVPLLLGSEEQVAAVHAGWRGLEAKILSQLPKDFAHQHIFIGPHIQKNSFEVGHDVALRLQAANPRQDLEILAEHPDPEKRFVDLAALTRAQLEFYFPETSVQSLSFDTYSHEDFASYRRLKGTTERQYSFAALIP